MSTTPPAAQSTTDAAGDLFLSGTYLELGLSPWGNFGTTQGETPAGYAQAGTHGVGLTFNAAGFGVNPAIPTIDFFTPGTPWESFAVGYTSGGANVIGNNYKDGGVEGVTPVSLVDTSSGTTLSAEFIGVLDGDLRVTIDYAFGVNAQYFTTTVTLTNLTGASMADVRYDRDVDPDNTVFAGGGYATINTIVAQEPGGGASEVTAVSASADPYDVATGTTATLAYYATGPGVVVSDGYNFGSGALDPFNPAFTTGAGLAGSTTGLSDTAININYDGGALAAGASTGFTYDTAVTSDFTSVLAAITAASVPTTPTVTLDPGSDSGAIGDGITNVTTPTLRGTATPGATVTVSDASGGVVAILGTAIADGTGAWTLVPASPLAQGANGITAAETAPGTSTASAPLMLTIDSVAPVVTAMFVANPLDATADGIVYSPILAGTGDPNAVVTVKADEIPIGTTVANASGAWTFDPSGLAAGGATLDASETDAAGNTGCSAATPLAQPAPRFTVADHSAGTAGGAPGDDYTGPVDSLQAQFAYVGGDDVVIVATVPNAFLVSGSGDDALQAMGGDNVLDGGSGSNWLVGATGADGGRDTFFVDGRDGRTTWDTLVNFHAGDMLTVWGFDAATGHTAWADGQGSAGYLGATLTAALGGGAASVLVTFDGLSTANARFALSTGSAGGVDYLAVTRTA